jgi:hypothetical protein
MVSLQSISNNHQTYNGFCSDGILWIQFYIQKGLDAHDA